MFMNTQKHMIITFSIHFYVNTSFSQTVQFDLFNVTNQSFVFVEACTVLYKILTWFGLSVHLSLSFSLPSLFLSPSLLSP